jgi:long-chain acyl-CoA synthetase
VLVMNSHRDPSTAVERANQQLAEFQQIRHWILWPEPDLPRTSTGKILRREVARRIASGEINTTQPVFHETLNLDSLGRVQLQARLEQQYGVSLDDAALQQVKTREDVRKLIQQALPAPVNHRPEASPHLYPHWPWNPLMQLLRSAFLEGIAMLLVRFLAKPRTSCMVRQWPSSPMLIVANHVTSYDVPLILYALPGHIRKHVAVAMSGEMILDWRRARNQGHWFLNAVAPIEYLLVTAFFNIFPLPQFSGFRRSFRHAGEAMDRGYNVIIFPEGRRSDDGSLQPFKAGAGLLWKELGAPALPVYLEGLGEIKTQRARWFRTGRIRISVGSVLPLEGQKNPDELTGILRDAVLRLS